MVELPPQFRAKRIPPVFPRFSPPHGDLPPSCPATYAAAGSLVPNREGSAGAKIVFSFTIPGESLRYASNDVEYSRDVEFYNGCRASSDSINATYKGSL